MKPQQKTQKTVPSEQQPAWEARHENDAREPLSVDPSDVPTRSSDIREGSPGEISPVSGSGFQESASAAHPAFPAGGGAEQDDDDAVRRRAYQLWEEEGFPEDGQERHWLQAEREVRGGHP